MKCKKLSLVVRRCSIYTANSQVRDARLPLLPTVCDSGCHVFSLDMKAQLTVSTISTRGANVENALPKNRPSDMHAIQLHLNA